MAVNINGNSRVGIFALFFLIAHTYLCTSAKLNFSTEERLEICYFLRFYKFEQRQIWVFVKTFLS